MDTTKTTKGQLHTKFETHLRTGACCLTMAMTLWSLSYFYVYGTDEGSAWILEDLTVTVSRAIKIICEANVPQILPLPTDRLLDCIHSPQSSSANTGMISAGNTEPGLSYLLLRY